MIHECLIAYISGRQYSGSDRRQSGSGRTRTHKRTYVRAPTAVVYVAICLMNVLTNTLLDYVCWWNFRWRLIPGALWSTIVGWCEILIPAIIIFSMWLVVFCVCSCLIISAAVHLYLTYHQFSLHASNEEGPHPKIGFGLPFLFCRFFFVTQVEHEVP